MKVLINVTPLSTGHAIRGVGMYTRFLTEALERQPGIEVFRSDMQRSGRADLVHYPFFDLFYPTLPLIKSAKAVVTIHDVIPLLFPQFYPVGRRGALALGYQKLSLKTAAAVITDSEASKRDIISHLGLPEDKIHVVYLAANPFLQKISGQQLLSAQRKLKLPKKYLLYVGDINYNKNLPQLIKALKFLPADLKLVFVGKNFIPQEIPEWRAIADQTALTDPAGKQVIFMPDIGADDYDSLSAVYSGAAVYVQPSLYEGFGLPVLESMRCQTPVVAAGNSSLKEIGGDAVRFTGNTAEELAAGINEVLNFSANERKEFVKKALAWEKHFSWDKTAKKTIEVYKKII